MEDGLDKMESFWLKRSPYLGGDTPSVADIVGACEIEQVTAADYDYTVNRPLLKQWMSRVKEDFHPHYNDVTKYIYQLRETYRAKSNQKSSSKL